MARAAGPVVPAAVRGRCEHHLHVNGVEAITDDGWAGGASYLRRRLDTAFRREEGWAELLAQSAGFPSTTAWLDGIRDEVGLQVAVRWLLPAHHSTAALDTALGRLRDFLDSRSFVLRNAPRTNVLLWLIRNHLTGEDIEPRYRTQLRAIVEELGGRVGRQRSTYDPRLDPRFPTHQRRYPGSLRV